ncbi:MAG: patatin family protein [Clostridia bacterium]|nr:patatin family protein [Clostridia bacterium]
MMKNKVYSGIDNILSGTAPDNVIEGCMVLEGGAFRGVYTEGVLDYLMTQGINMSCTVGVSAGAINAANYVSGQIGRSARTNLRFRHNSDYVGLRAIRKNDGIIGFDFLYNELEKIEPLDRERMYDERKRIVAVVTNLLTGKEEYIDRDECSDFLQAIRASASLPLVSKPVLVDGTPCLDGGCVCKIPFDWAIKEGYEKIIVIKTREDTFRKPDEVKTEQIKLANFIYKDYPEFAKVLPYNDVNYNEQCDRLDKLRDEGKVFVMSPSQPVIVGRLEPDMEKLGELYFLGVEDAKRSFDELKKYLEK